ncbi:ABC transporter substrate-binding protein [Actinotalea ferrariae CF5-4]|uniref:ABC transporter substrate-binding protein n=1 Tax=Actinotalea ferrariae CF5-4 TaxID=948458 RepID=A0A021VRT4_9CELL|nr:ABC transporter family substrate-binding protein [Actinotalea ferrariae]EYR63879.1 ABC transporter substrate-binding protein [Actinotalea ferrariae CF5-4]
MKLRRIGATGAIVATGALVLSACATPTQEAENPIEESTSMSIGWNQPFYAQNNLTSTGNATTNANVLYLTQSSFNYYDGDLNLAKNEDFGTYEVVSEDPFTVEYTINEGVTWSDGTPVDAADVLLWWGAQNDSFDNVEPEYDEEGNISNQDAIDAGVYFDSSSVAMGLITEAPEISEDGRTITFVYDTPRSDWEISIQPSPIAAHALAGVALEVEDPAEGKQRVIDAFTESVTEDLSPMAKAWNESFNFTSLPEDERLFLSSGAYVMTEYVENQYLTLQLREDYDWGPIPTIDEITIRYSEDPLASVTALQNGEVDLIQPQSSVDVLATLDGIDGVQYTTQAEGTYEHVDVIFNNGGPFDPAAYGGDAEKARAVRQAFLLSIPREEIIEKLIKPLQEDAEMRNSHTVVPGSPAYDEVVAANGSDFYTQGDEANRQAAIALLQEAGVTTPIDVRFLYGASNVRRANEYQLIQASASQVGFNVIDEGDDNWGSRLTDTASYDASLFGWQSTNTFALNSEANYVTGGLNNFGGFSDPDIDAWYAEMATNTDPERETELTILIEERLNEQGFSVPIFQFPGVVAWRDTLQNVKTIPLSPTIFWNYWEWEIGAADEAAEE